MSSKLLTLLFAFCLVFSVNAQESAEATAEATADTEVTPASKYNDALAELKAKNYVSASALFDEALTMADTTEDAEIIKLAKANGAISNYYLGNKLLKEKSYDEAIAAYQTGIEMNPKQYSNLYGISKVYYSQKMAPEAVDAAVKAYNAAKEAGDEETGLKYFKTAQGAITKAYSAKKYAEVIAAGKALVEVDQADTDVHYYMAKSMMKEGNAAGAVEHAAKAAEMGGTEKEGKYIYAHAEALEAAGKKSSAKSVYATVPAGKYKESADYKAKNL